MMIDKCLDFSQLSDLFDDDISTVEEKEAMLNHIDLCPKCREEYDRLKHTMELCHEYSTCGDLACRDLAFDIIRRARRKKRNRLLWKTLPAAAAAILIVLSLGLVDNNIFSSGDEVVVAETVPEESLTDNQQVVNIIRDHNAEIVKISDLYIEGRVPYENFNTLRRNLGFRKVAYQMEQGQTVTDKPRVWRENLEEVGSMPDSPFSLPFEETAPETDRYVVFRVYR